MGDIENHSQSLDPQASGAPEGNSEPPGPDVPGVSEKKRISPWVWVGVAAAVLLVGAWFLSSSSDGTGRLALLFRGGTVEVPLVLGQTESQAQGLITASGLRVGQVSQVATLAVAPGLVVAQTPAPDTKVKADSAVDLSVSAVPQTQVPDVIGKTESAASQTLAEQGLRIGVVSYAYDASVDAGKITAQDPGDSKEVAVGSAVDITVSKGEQQGKVPNVVGLAQSDAESTIEGAGFKSTSKKTTSTGVTAGDVISQSPSAGTVVTAGSTVTITVSTGPPAPAEPTPPPADSGTEPEAPAAPDTPATPDTPPADKPTEKPEPAAVEVPDLIGMRVIEALGALRNANLKFEIAWAPSENILVVVEQDPAAGSSVDPGTSVKITIGLPSFSFEKPEQLPATQPAPTPVPAQPAQPSDGPTGGAETTSAP